ncbi:MAG: dynamin family protein [Pseudomonadales bacterium]|nr:dynamin family protein [Pseudomonadales bacterium]
MERVSADVKSYGAWKNELRAVIAEYKVWSQRQQLLSPELEEQLLFLEDYLQQDKIQLAFVGEFSRGKTELINALFFADCGRRLLPSHLGRTTMCPTELFFDEKAESTYLRLLPIDTRIEEYSLQYYLSRPECWLEVPFNSANPDQMAETLKKVTETQEVSKEEASDLGFDLHFLEACRGGGGSDTVVVPAWRHALVNFDHPLLRQGLTILDTPGLNALGCEPDLTLNLLPECLGVIFMLNADAGVTSTDLQVWNEYISNLRLTQNAGLFAVLNKIDGVWDALESTEYNEEAVARLRTLTAQQLELEEDHVLALSAKMGLHAKITGDTEELSKSNLGTLERALSVDVLGHKEASIRSKVVRTLLQTIKQSKSSLKENKLALEEQQKIFRLNHDQAREHVKHLLLNAKQAQLRYQQQLELLKRSRDVLLGKRKVLLRTVHTDHIERYREQVKRELNSSWTSLGMSSAIKNFFAKVRSDLQRLGLEAAEVDVEVQRIYFEYKKLDVSGIELVQPDFSVEPLLEKMDVVKAQALASHTHLSALLLSQSKVTKRFFNSVVLEVDQIFKNSRTETDQWLKMVLQPLILHTRERKHLLENQIMQCKQVSGEGKKKREQLEVLRKLIVRIEEKNQDLNEFILRVQEPPLLQ